MFTSVKHKIRSTALSERKTYNGISYNGVQGLLTTVSVIAALLLTLLVGLQYVQTPEVKKRIDFNSLICTYKDFRIFAVKVMKEKEEKEPGLLNVKGLDSTAFNVEEVLVGPSWRFDDAEVRTTTSQRIACLGDSEVSTAVNLIVEDFPINMMNAWISRHPTVNGMPLYTWSKIIDGYTAVSLGLNLGSLILTIFQYVGLEVSGIPDDATANSKAGSGGRHFRMWLFINGFTIILNIFLLAIGTIYCFMGQVYYVISQNILFAASYEDNWHVGLKTVALPIGMWGVFLSLVSVIASMCVNRTLPSSPSGQDEFTEIDSDATAEEDEDEQ
jgi:hypothetical protein